MSQPALSIHVRELEYELDAALFERLGWGVRLAPAGEVFHALAAPLVEGMVGLLENFAERIEIDVTGHLELAASVTGAAIVLPPYVKRFRERYPGGGCG